ncbi:MAG: Methyltransferase [Myxococcaceae bacterium]|nr:Methyltransferase [Myxococcaceae bacterium]
MLCTPSVSTEYVNDVPYVRHFIGDLSPARLRLVAALNGVTPPPGDELDYCELGCAHGDTLAALAAAHPQGRFLGIDISATHIASAKKLARDGGLENIGFLERDYADLIAEDIGEFDFIVAYGLLTWVSPDKRKALLDFASAKLKPGGLLYVSYNAMPGWASVEPLRQLLLSPVGAPTDAAGASLERARRGVEFAKAMEASGAEYFTKNPAASEMLATMTKAGLPYVIHEYLHEHWTPMYFARVAWEMAESDLHFVGVSPLFLNFRDTAIPESLDSVFAGVTDRATFESLKDFAVNEFFRRDVYVKGKVARSADVTNAYLASTAWGTLASALPDDRTVTLHHRTLKLDAPIFEPLFAAVAERATTLDDLAERPELATFGIEKLRAALLRLLLGDNAIPMQAPGRSATPIGDGLFRIPSVYNQMMLRRLSSDTPIVMTSTVAGTAFPISALDGLALRVFTEVAPPERESWIRDFVGKNVLRLAVGDHVVEDQADQRAVILEAVEKLRTHRLAKLVELGVLAPL